MKALSICLISPRFEPSFWGREYALPLLPGDKRAWMVAGGLPLLAALVPVPHSVTLIDEAVEPIDFEALKSFDVIGLTGMIVQRDRMREILLDLRDHDAQVIVGGPYASIDEGFFDGLCDAIFVGEADTTWPAFIDTLAQGQMPDDRYEQATKTDMTTVPQARFDLMKGRHYVSASLQYSRGCPFTCEFCDIIVIFGRRPRVKDPAQVITELDQVRKAGFDNCFVVDDNFIGNKVAVKKLLPEIIAWQEKHGYPLTLSTEATINLADDPDLLDLMCRANFRDVFIGIESPRAASLAETRKLQNVRGDPMADKLARIRDAGIVVSAGFIVGFDEDDADIFAEQLKFIDDNNIGQAALGTLFALPKTPLHDRLAAEGRLRPDDPMCNFEPKQMSSQALVSGSAETQRQLFQAEAFFGRIRRNLVPPSRLLAQRALLHGARAGWPQRMRQAMQTCAVNAVIAVNLGQAIWRDGPLWSGLAVYAREYRKMPRGLMSLRSFLTLCALHWHHHLLTRNAAANARDGISLYGAAPVADNDISAA
ncbi:MAG: radical SAM protein [Pseudomonadota bacterium]